MFLRTVEILGFLPSAELDRLARLGGVCGREGELLSLGLEFRDLGSGPRDLELRSRDLEPRSRGPLECLLNELDRRLDGGERARSKLRGGDRPLADLLE